MYILRGLHENTNAPVTRWEKDMDVTVTVLKYAYSMGRLIFPIVIVMSAISATRQRLLKKVLIFSLPTLSNGAGRVPGGTLSLLLGP